MSLLKILSLTEIQSITVISEHLKLFHPFVGNSFVDVCGQRSSKNDTDEDISNRTSD